MLHIDVRIAYFLEIKACLEYGWILNPFLTFFTHLQQMLVDIDFVHIPIDLHSDWVLLASNGDVAIDQALHIEILFCAVVVMAHCFD